jgi:protein required for attachment to host cells
MGGLRAWFDKLVLGGIAMRTSWILIADSSRARIFEKKEHERHLEEVEDFVDNLGRATNHELRTDGRGRFYGKGERDQGHAAEPAVSPVEHENELFAHTLTRYLDDARKAHRYNRLYLIAPPKFLGLIRGSLDDEVKKMIQGELQKDISTFTAGEVEDYVKENIWML